MDARATRLRRILAQTDRATDRVSSIVQRTDAELAELSGLMGPIEARTQRLSNAHKNLTAVHDETEQWLEHLEVSWTSGSTLERDFEDDDDHDALLRGVDALVDAEAFFARRRAYRGAESSRKHCAELLDRHLERCELEFARLLDHHARAAESSREHTAANDPNPNPDADADALADAPRVADVAVIPPPPPPVSAQPLTPVTPALARFASAHLRTPTQGTPRTPTLTPTLSARRAETHYRALFDVSPRLAALARTLRASPAPGVRDTRAAASRLYVAARRAALDAAIDRMGHAGLMRDADRVAAPPPPVAPGLGDGEATESRVARWLAGVADATARWTAEERLAMEIFGEDLDGRAAREVVPLILEAAARRALAPVEAFAAQPSGKDDARGAGGGAGAGAWAGAGAGAGARARDGDRDAATSDADPRHSDPNPTRGCPEKVFALVRARDALTRARWGLETTLREDGGALREWRRATETATTGARRAVAETTATTRREAARVGAGWDRAGADAPERAAAEAEGLARGVVAHLARVAELHDARTWLFAEDEAETTEGKDETDHGHGDGEDSDGILDFTDSDDDDVSAPTPTPATGPARGGERIASASASTSASASAASFAASFAAEKRAAEAADSKFAALAADALAAATETFASPRPPTVAPARSRPPTAATTAPPLTPALAAAARAFAVDAIREAAESSESEALRTALSRSGWSHRAEAMAAERTRAYMSAAWGAAIDAMDPDRAPDPRNMNDKQRQSVKDRFTAVNAAAEEAAANAAAINAATPSERTRRRLADATRAAVVGPYREFRARYENSGFTRKNPEKYLKHAPEALDAIVEASFGSAREGS